MRGLRRNPFLAGTAVALALSFASTAYATSNATEDSAAAIEAGFPIPEPANVPPLGPADVGGPVTGTADPAADPEPEPSRAVAAPEDTPAMVDGVPVPVPADVPPLSVQDLGPPALAAADQAVADRLREIAGDKLARLVGRKAERAAVQSFYEARNFAPIWIENGAVSPKAKAAIARLKAADADGLDSTDYATPDPSLLANDPDSLAEADIKLTAAVLDYARDAQAGRTVPSRLSNNMEYASNAPEPASVLATVTAATDVTKALDAYNPPHEGYKALKRKLAEARARLGNANTPRIATGPLVKVGSKDERVPLLRKRLGLAGDADDLVYDRELSNAVKAFQAENGLKKTGNLNTATINALNGPSQDKKIDAIVANMERWRWLPRDLGRVHVMVNIPDYTLKVVRDGKTVFRTRIVVGKAATPTPIFSDKIENIVVNPTWYVPPSIIYNEYLPALEQDPEVLSRMGLRLARNRDGSIQITQPPGERNALGRLKFNFPNRFMVYLHDTPQKHLFAHDQRAYSHGCMRVQNPEKFAEVLLSAAMPNERWDAERITKAYGKGERWLKFEQQIPVHITYMNAFVDEDDKLVLRKDIYGYDSRVQLALKTGNDNLAETRTAKREAPPVRRVEAARAYDRYERMQQPNPFFFLERLFR